MPIKVIIEFQAKPGARAELKKLLADISTTHGPEAPRFLGSAVDLVVARFKASRIGLGS